MHIWLYDKLTAFINSMLYFQVKGLALDFGFRSNVFGLGIITEHGYLIITIGLDFDG